MVRGGCLCGEVRFELEGRLSEIEVCHCRKCRRAHGAPFAATLYGRRSHFRWTRGEALVRSYDAPLEESPPAYRHSFCSHCGAALPLLWNGLPFVEVPVSCLDTPVDSRPAYQLFASQRVEWVGQLDGLRRYERGAPAADKVVRALL